MNNITLAMLEALAGHSINTKPLKPKTDFKKQVKHKRPTGLLNTICISCGHKNKKCTCKEN